MWEASGQVGKAAYESDWLYKEESFKKIVLMVILKSRAPLRFNAGMAGELKLSKFVAAMKNWYRILQALLNLT